MKVVASNLHKRATHIVFAMILAVSAITANVSYILTHKVSADTLTTITSSPSSQNGWVTQDGAPSYVAGPAGADGSGSLQLSTVTASKQNYFHAANTSLSAVKTTTLGYKLNVTSGVPASYQLQVVGVNRLDGNTNGFTSLVWEPVYNGQPNGANGGFVSETNLQNGTWWSSNPIPGAPNRDTFVSLQTIIDNNPGATVVAYGVNVGSGTPNATSYVDDVQFGNTVTNFELDPLAAPSNFVLRDGAQGYSVINPGVVAKSHNPVNAQLSWDPVAGATGYSVEVFKDGQSVGGSSFGWNGSWVGFDGNNYGKGDGVYTFKACAYTATQSSCATDPHSYIIDTTAPANVVVSPLNSNGTSVVHGTVNFSVSTSEPHFSYSYIEVNQNGVWKTDNTHGTSSYNGSTLNWSWNSATVPDGKYTLKVDVVDQAGNATEKMINFTVDNTKPVITGITPVPNSILTGTKTFTVNATDTNPSYVYVELNKNGTWITDNTHNGTTGATSSSLTYDLSTLSDGTYTIKVDAVDKAGNTTEQIYNYVVDNTFPVVSFVSPTPAQNSYVGGNVTLATTITDAHMGPYNLRVDNSGLAYIFTPTSGATNSYMWNSRTVSDGSHTILATTTDQAGNKTTITRTLIVDNTAPASPSFTAPTSLYLTSHTATFNWTDESDNGSPVKYNVTSSLTNAVDANGKVQNPIDTQSFATNQATFSGFPDGTYYLQVQAVDAVGNTSAWSAPKEVIVDTQVPSVTLNQATLNGSTPTITGDVNDPTATVIITIDGNPANAINNGNGTWTYSVITPLIPGDHTVSVVAKDAAGNTTNPAATGTVTVTSQANGQPAALVSTIPSSSNTTNTPTNDTTGVLGDSTTTPSTDTSNGDVKGDSTNKPQDKVADATTKAGNLFGLAWYWWLIILAAAIAIIWWIVAAARNRSAQN